MCVDSRVNTNNGAEERTPSATSPLHIHTAKFFLTVVEGAHLRNLRDTPPRRRGVHDAAAAPSRNPSRARARVRRRHDDEDGAANGARGRGDHRIGAAEAGDPRALMSAQLQPSSALMSSQYQCGAGASMASQRQPGSGGCAAGVAHTLCATRRAEKRTRTSRSISAPPSTSYQCASTIETTPPSQWHASAHTSCGVERHPFDKNAPATTKCAERTAPVQLARSTPSALPVGATSPSSCRGAAEPSIWPRLRRTRRPPGLSTSARANARAANAPAMNI